MTSQTEHLRQFLWANPGVLDLLDAVYLYLAISDRVAETGQITVQEDVAYEAMREAADDLVNQMKS